MIKNWLYLLNLKKKLFPYEIYFKSILLFFLRLNVHFSYKIMIPHVEMYIMKNPVQRVLKKEPMQAEDKFFIIR